MICAVGFDLDGTLIDSTDAIVSSFFHTFDTLGLQRAPREAIVSSIGHTLEHQFSTMTTHDPHECTRIYRERYGKIACDMTTLLPGAREGLEALAAAGVKIGYATSKRSDYADMILAHLGVLDFFEARIGPEHVSRPKPDPEALLKAADSLGVAESDFVFVGDTDFDVLAARAAGIRCVGVATGYNTFDQLVALQPERVFMTLPEATAYLLEETRR